jgi:hypothetical protein
MIIWGLGKIGGGDGFASVQSQGFACSDFFFLFELG